MYVSMFGRVEHSGECKRAATPMYELHRLQKKKKKYRPHIQHKHWHTGTEEWQRRVSPVIIVLDDERSEAEKGVEECWRGDRGGGGGEGVEGGKKGWLICTKAGCCLTETLLIVAIIVPTNCPPPQSIDLVFNFEIMGHIG